MSEKLVLPKLDFDQMDPEDIRAADTSQWIAVLSLGATEQHGPHLPLETDTLIAEGVVERIKQALSKNSGLTFLKAEPVGYSPEHLDYPGSLSLNYDEAIRRWVAIGDNLNGLGIRKLILLNAHGGNSPLMTIVATELRVRFNMLCVATSWTRFGKPDGLIDKKAASIDIHGGDIETSVMLALHPDQVDVKACDNFTSNQSRWLKQNKYLHAYGRHAFGWKMQDLNPLGVTGNAKNASAEKGEALLSHSVAGFLKLAEEVADFDVTLFDKSL
ncbi:MAG: creatininase family protein [Salaquimonas sp.]